MTTRLLIADDDLPSLKLAAYLLEHAGYATLTADNGERAVAVALQARPDAIICDLQLPMLDGFEVLRRVRQDPAASRTIVIAVTAYAMVGDQQKVLQAGFDGYISKPIETENFVQQIEAFLPAALRARPGGAS